MRRCFVYSVHPSGVGTYFLTVQDEARHVVAVREYLSRADADRALRSVGERAKLVRDVDPRPELTPDDLDPDRGTEPGSSAWRRLHRIPDVDWR